MRKGSIANQELANARDVMVMHMAAAGHLHLNTVI
jgi:hypothetical protein